MVQSFRCINLCQSVTFFCRYMKCGICHVEGLEYPLFKEIRQRHISNDLHDMPQYINGITVAPLHPRLENQGQRSDPIYNFLQRLVSAKNSWENLTIQVFDWRIEKEAVTQTSCMGQ